MQYTLYCSKTHKSIISIRIEYYWRYDNDEETGEQYYKFDNIVFEGYRAVWDYINKKYGKYFCR